MIEKFRQKLDILARAQDRALREKARRKVYGPVSATKSRSLKYSLLYIITS